VLINPTTTAEAADRRKARANLNLDNPASVC
jgi:hypothetical protein